MSDTTTITPEERAYWRRVIDEEPLIPSDDEKILRLLTALEAAEARAEKAESDKAALEEDLEATEKNLKEFSGFIEELFSGLKHRFPVQYAAIEGDEYGDDAFSSHDLFELVIDPAVDAAQKAEAENARLRAERDWLVSWFDAHPCCMDLQCPFGRTLEQCEAREGGMLDSTECWQEAARCAVAESEVGK